MTGEALSPLVEVVDFRHVSKENLLFVLQRGWDEVKHSRVVHLRGIALYTQQGRSWDSAQDLENQEST